MSQLSRRRMIASIGLFGGTAAWAGCGGELGASSSAFADPAGNPSPRGLLPLQPPPENPPGWNYALLDPKEIADRAYRMYPDGACSYAVFGSVVTTLAERIGEPFRSFPVEMMRFGEGGIAGFGTVCGALNGAAALIGLFRPGKEQKDREPLVTELFTWYEQTALPRYAPPSPGEVGELRGVAVQSVLCHISVSRWCEETGYAAFDIERRERCRRLSCDVAAKIVDILNCCFHPESTNHPGGNPYPQDNPADLSVEVRQCISCHGRNELANSLAKMDCRACHTFDGRHP